LDISHLIESGLTAQNRAVNPRCLQKDFHPPILLQKKKKEKTLEMSSKVSKVGSKTELRSEKEKKKN
jgi:hypothetical protein